MNAPLPVFNSMTIHGKIIEVREWESGEDSGYVTRCKLPAVDEYESAPTIELSSRKKLGKPDEVIKVPVRINGFVKRGKNASGKDYDLVNMRLVAVEG